MKLARIFLICLCGLYAKAEIADFNGYSCGTKNAQNIACRGKVPGTCYDLRNFFLNNPGIIEFTASKYSAICCDGNRFESLNGSGRRKLGVYCVSKSAGGGGGSGYYGPYRTIVGGDPANRINQ